MPARDLNGLYKIELETAQGSASGVAVARDGRISGGNSAFAFAGRYEESGDEITAEISVLRHNDDATFERLFGVDEFTIPLKGRRRDEHFVLKGDASRGSGMAFSAVMTAISEAASPPAGVNGADGIRNGLYSLNIRMLDGIDSSNTGIMVLHDGTIRGGDAFFDYVGAYSSANGRWKGELINHEHTPTRGDRPLLGGRAEVGIGFSGTYNEDGAEGEATALAGKRSIRFRTVLRRLA
jgi:hypothetical protein